MTEEIDVARLADRVARLEQRLGSVDAEPRPERGDASTFWALNELKRRQPLPTVLYVGTAVTAEGAPVEWQMAYGSADLTDQDWGTHSPVLAALGHPTRMQILQLVARGEAHSAADLAHTDGLGTTGQIYHHLRQLVSAGWLRATTKGRHEIPPERLVPLLTILAAAR